MIEPGDYVRCIYSGGAPDECPEGAIALVLRVWTDPNLHCWVCGDDDNCPSLELAGFDNTDPEDGYLTGYCSCCFRPLYPGEREKVVVEREVPLFPERV